MLIVYINNGKKYEKKKTKFKKQNSKILYNCGSSISESFHAFIWIQPTNFILIWNGEHLKTKERYFYLAILFNLFSIFENMKLTSPFLGNYLDIYIHYGFKQNVLVLVLYESFENNNKLFVFIRK